MDGVHLRDHPNVGRCECDLVSELPPHVVHVVFQGECVAALECRGGEEGPGALQVAAVHLDACGGAVVQGIPTEHTSADGIVPHIPVRDVNRGLL